MDMTTPLNLYRGSKEKIQTKLSEITDGNLIFSVDTKQIFMDYKGERILFGGSTGIWYGLRNDLGDEGKVIFKLAHLEGAEEYPSPRDLILNSDGSFFKVEEVSEKDDEIVATRLTIAGGGGSGPGSSTSSYIDYKRVGVKNRYFSAADKEMLLTFQAYSTAGEDTEMGATVFLVDAGGVKHTLGTINNIGQSWGDEAPISINIKDLILAYGVNQNVSYDIEVSLFDDVGNTSLRTIPYTITVFDMQVKAVKQNIGTWKGESYRCIPIFFTDLENVQLFYRVINIAYSSIVQTNYPDNGKALAKNDNNNEQLIDISYDIPVGAYKIQTWIQATIPGTSGQTIVESNPLEQTFIKQSDDSSDPILSINFPDANLTYGQYDLIEIPYMVSYRNTTISVVRTVEFTAENGTVTKTSENLTQATETEHIWQYRIMELGSYKFTVQVGANVMNASTSDLYYVNTKSDTVPTVTTAGLVLNLTANKSNDSVDKDSWTSVTSSKVVESKLTGFNWISNGWRTINGETSLYLNNGAKAEVFYSPFATNARTNGVTIEFDVKISNIRNRHSELIKCISRDNDGTLHTGTIINGDYFTLNSSSKKPIDDYNNLGYINLSQAGMTATYVPGKRVRISFVITPYGRSPYAGMASNMVCTYVNGVLSGFVAYGEDNFVESPSQNAESGKFIFDSTDADIDIYNLRVYQTALTDRAILSNYFATFADFSASAAAWADNDILTDEGEISLEKVMKKGNIPYVLMRGGITVDSKKGKNFITPITTGLPVRKDDYKLVDVCFIDPENPAKNIGSLASEDRKEWVIYAQGTSSMEYPIKNLRSKYARDNIKETYQLFDDLPGVDLFCFKVDYMESASAHNTGLGNMLNELYGGIKTPSRLINDTYTAADGTTKSYDYVTAIKGRPCIIFFKETATDPRELRKEPDNYQGYKFIGRYNFNLDKSTHEPFGFYSDVDRHYGVAIENPPPLGPNYANDIKEKEILKNSYFGTLDESPEEGKEYFKDPEGTTLWTWDEIAEWDSEEGEYIWKIKSPAYEFIGEEGINSIQVWECLDNNKPLTHFTQRWEEADDPECALWVENFESRYPEYPEEEMSDKRDLQRLVNWVADTSCMKVSETESVDDEGKTTVSYDYTLYSHEPSYDDIVAENIPEDLEPLIPNPENPRMPAIKSYSSTTGKYEYESIDGYYYNSYEYRLHKFQKEFDDYFESDLTMFYYILTEFLLMTDSRAKNMMLCTFTARCKDSEGNSKTKWFPIFYDMDTALAVNNMGQLKFSYKDEDWYEDIFNAEAGYVNQRGTLNKSFSALWANIQLTMYDRIKDVYHSLRTGAFNYDYLLAGYNTNQAERWNETYINKDAYLKYVEPYINKTAWKVMVDACQGTRSLHREQYLRRRFLYMDSKYAYIQGGMGLSLRVNDLQRNPGDIFNFDLTTNDAMYLVSQFGNEQPVRSKNVIGENTTVNISTRSPSGGGVGEQPYYLYLIDNIRSFGDMSDMGIQTFDPYQKAPSIPSSPDVEYENNNKLENLVLSTNKEGYEYELKLNNRMANLEIIKYFPMLNDLNVGYWNALGTLDLRYNKNLKTLEAFGTKINSCQFPNGGTLEHLQLPATLTRFAITGHYNLHTIEYKEYDSNYEESYVVNPDSGSNTTTPPIEITINRLKAWDKLIGISIEQCPNLDTKSIFKQMKEDNLQIYFPDLNWTIEADEMVISNGMIESIPIVDKLLRQYGYNGELRDEKVLDENGMPTYDEDGNQITIPTVNRSYVGGRLLLKNGEAGLDEALMYQKYTKYYPLLTIEVENWNDNCIRAYSLNTHDANGELMVGNSPKFTSDNVEEEFTLENVFGTEATSIKIAPVEKMPTNEYVFEFKGWNTEGVLTFSERDYKTGDNTIEDSINAAKEACDKKLIIGWDGKDYSAKNNFNFANVFNADNQELNIYPTFVATVRTWTATFSDGQGNIVDEQKVRYGEKAIVPTIQPIKIELDAEDVSKTYIYPFERFGAVGESYIVTADKTYEAVYSKTKKDIREYPASVGYFNHSNILTILKDTYVAEAICIPKDINGEIITQIRFGRNQKVKRIYFEAGSTIQVFGDSACEGMDQLEYIDFSAMTSLTTVANSACSDRKLLTGSNLPDSVTSIGSGSFSGCSALNFTKLPAGLQELNVNSFASCKGLTTLDMSACVNLKTIPGYCFSYCENLRLAGDDLPVNIIEIGSGAFTGCLSLVMNFAHATNVATVLDSAFARTSNLTLNNLPDKLSIISTSAFQGNPAVQVSAQSLNFIMMPSALTEIGARAFQWRNLTNGILNMSKCTLLTNDKINADAFTGFQGISTIILPQSLQNTLTVPANCWGAGENIEVQWG